jgi:3-hydroxyisobutyrate dehydrogenase-like beta-hydroxyacid dehydrogenase
MTRLAWIGLGEAGAAFASAIRVPAAIGYDRKIDDPALRAGKLADFAAAGVVVAADPAQAVHTADAVLSLVTADQVLAAAEAASPHLRARTLWFDMNSVSPDTKRAAARAVERGGARYLDVAVMAPVLPARTAVPLLVSGDHADAGAAMLRHLGFSDVTVLAGGVGAASAVKMIRSVMIKGIEALSAECVLAAEAACVRDAVIASLNASWPHADWGRRFDYNLDRMLVHGLRRADEMEEVAATLESLGTGSAMTRAAVTGQRALGQLRIAPPAGLAAKLHALDPSGSPMESRAA